MKICLVFPSTILSMINPKGEWWPMAISHSCKTGKHRWCLEVAYDNAIDSTDECQCTCHKEEQEDDGEI